MKICVVGSGGREHALATVLRRHHEVVVTPGNPVKMSAHTETEPTRPPWQGEHTRQVLADELGLSTTELDRLTEEGVIA